MESKLAACRNYAKDQQARKSYNPTSNGTLLNSNATKFPHSLHTTYLDKTSVCLLYSSVRRSVRWSSKLIQTIG